MTVTHVPTTDRADMPGVIIWTLLSALDDNVLVDISLLRLPPGYIGEPEAHAGTKAIVAFGDIRVDAYVDGDTTRSHALRNRDRLVLAPGVSHAVMNPSTYSAVECIVILSPGLGAEAMASMIAALATLRIEEAEVIADRNVGTMLDYASTDADEASTHINLTEREETIKQVHRAAAWAMLAAETMMAPDGGGETGAKATESADAPVGTRGLYRAAISDDEGGGSG